MKMSDISQYDRMPQVKNTKADKLMSGRWLLTLAVFISIIMMGFANIMVVLKDPDKKPPFEMKELMVAVVVFYFTRPPNSETK